MAKQRSNRSNPNTTTTQTNTFIKGMNRDSDPSFVEDGMWTHARNASNNTSTGDLGTLSNEESNALCAKVMQTVSGFNKDIIGVIHLFSDNWVIYSVAYDALDGKPTSSEIGLFEEDICRYRPIVNDPCLNFSKLHLITGASRLLDDCSWEVYWADNLNPDRHMNIGDPKLWIEEPYTFMGGANGSTTINFYSNGTNRLLWPGVPWMQDCETTPPVEVDENGDGNPDSTRLECRICKDLNKLDCDQLRIARLLKTPCLDIRKGQQPGSLPNGSYAVVAAYTIDKVRVTNYFSVSHPQPIYFDPDLRGSIEVDVDVDEEAFDEFELVLIRFTNQNEDNRRIGYYSTRTKRIIIDLFTDQNPNIDKGTILLKDFVFERSEQIIAANNYLLRLGPTSKFDFNYQPLANLIQAEWVSVEYDERYYFDGGNNAGYLRDEIYAFFIRWVYDTGDKSASYHIPGRPSGNYVTPAPYNVATTDRATIDGINSLGTSPLYDDDKVFHVLNTAAQTSTAAQTLPDGGEVIASGKMGYWESTEVYPDNRPDIWNSSYYCWTGSTATEYDLCGKNIRHHRFPDNGLTPNTYHFTKNANGDYKIRLMGVRFKNIIMPKDNDGNDIPNIVGYEILRGSRNGNKTILAKGMINNFRNYSIPGTPKAIAGGSPGTIGLYANYPYNCLIPQNNRTSILASNLNYANYKYNDPFIIRRAVDSDPQDPYKRLKQNIPIDIQSFHSPDTSYNNPAITASEMKVYGWLYGQATQRFIEPEKHPEFKLLDNSVVLIAAIGGIINVILNTMGEIKINYPEVNYTVPRYPYVVGNTTTGTGFSDPGGTAFIPAIPPNSGGLSGYTLAQPTLTTYNLGRSAYINGGGFVSDVLLGQDALSVAHQNTASLLGGYTNQFTLPEYNKTYTPYSLLPSFIQSVPNLIPGIAQLSQSLFFFQEGAKDTIDVLYAIVKTRQYALQLIGHGEYSEFRTYQTAPNSYNQSTKDRFRLPVGAYVRDQLFQFPTYQAQNYDYSFPDQPYTGEVNYRINNLLRPDLVVIRTTDDNENPSGPHFIIQDNPNLLGAPRPESVDQSSMTLGLLNKTPGYGWDLFNSATDNAFLDRNKSNEFENTIASYYVGLKFTFRNLYRQLDSIVQVMTTPCEQRIDFTQNSTNPNTIQVVPRPDLCNLNFTQTKIKITPVFFGGDTYVTRHTEKTIMPFFYEWLYGQADNYRFNYFRRQNVPEPRFMVNSNRWDFSDLNFQNLYQSIASGIPDTGEGLLPRDYYDLDNVNYNEQLNITGLYPGLIGVRNSYFYTSACGIKDFFVESEVLTDFRFAGRGAEEKSYNKWSFTDFQVLFSQNPAILTKGNYFRYDYSLSAARFLFSQYYNNGALQGTNYDPEVAELCYTSFPNRIQYSNVLSEHSAYDAWLMFLALNKVDFKSELNSVKTFGKTGLFVTFKNNSPLVFQGVDQRETYIGVKATIGDGGLFSTTPQNVVVSDQPYQYGACQGKFSVISTPAGIYFISQEQGKIFTYASNGLQEISQKNMKWWFDKFLPFKILEDFPDYPHTDNPVAGVGCSASYDNSNSVLYFSKRDYKLKEQYKNKLILDPDTNRFSIDNGNRFTIMLGDPRYFEDASWTISYDPKNQYWISFHDWVPGFYLPSKGHFLTTKKDGIWQHNNACNDYCNFYGTQYPFEVELPISTGQNVTTLRSIEYVLECYKKDNILCTDQYHVLDYNFSQAIISNSEQTSGILNLNIYPKNNVSLAQSYPKLNNNLTSFDILFSKEENKYRFNQFWDITLDRGEFPQGAGYPPAGPLVPNTTQLLGNYTENNIWITQPNGYVKNLNPVNLNYNKPLTQRKKFRHYSNFVKLIKDDSRDTNMVLKIVNTKSQLSTR